MTRISSFIVKYHKMILIAFTILAICSVWLMTEVNINTDITKYLPRSSQTKTGLEIIKSEFPAASSFNLLVEGIDEDEAAKVLSALLEIEHISGVSHDNSSKYSKDGYSLFVATLDVAAYTPESEAVIREVKDRFSSYDISLTGDAAGNTAIDIVPKIAGAAFAILFVILIFMCSSWTEPFLLLFSIAVAIALNMGTNIIFESVSDITFAIAAILQLVLSMDYSIMMLNRYRQEKALLSENNAEAMKRAIKGAFISITSSSVTTIVGMLALVLMSFGIGRDMGFVLAKGAFFSLLCMFTVLPGLVLLFDKLISKTAKPALHIKMDKIGAASYRIRFAVPVIFIALFAAAFFLRGNTGIAYTEEDYHKVNDIFTLDNPIVVLYENSDEAQVSQFVESWALSDGVTEVNAYSATLGKPMGSLEIAQTFGIDQSMAAQIYGLHAMMQGKMSSDDYKIPLYDFVSFLVNDVASNPAFAEHMTLQMQMMLSSAIEEMEAGKAQLVGDAFSRVVISTQLPEESEATFALIDDIKRDLDTLGGEHYIVGNSAIAHEMSESFPSEMNRITIITAIAIFAVVALAFRSLSAPLILVCIIQCAIFATMGIIHLQGNLMYYLALLIVQCLLLGATVDYGILLLSYYREARRTLERKEAIIHALNGSIHTILTSGSILVIVTYVLGAIISGTDPAISEILITIGTGGLCAMLLVIFVLPGLLAAFDRFVKGKLTVNTNRQ